MSETSYANYDHEPTYTEKIRTYIFTNIPYWTTIIVRYLMDALKATVNFINQLIRDAIGK